MRANLWDLALNSLSSQIAPSVQWDLLQKIMSNDGEWINKNDWSGTLNKLKVYVSNGGECDLRAHKPYQHIVNTHWMTDMLFESRYENQHTKMLKKTVPFGNTASRFRLHLRQRLRGNGRKNSIGVGRTQQRVFAQSFARNRRHRSSPQNIKQPCGCGFWVVC